MPDGQSRAKFFRENPRASAWAALDEATNQQQKTAPGAIKLGKGRYDGKRAVILGAGVAGLTTAYELLAQKSGMEVTVLEAQNRTGGRCLSLRTGDTLTEDADSKLTGSEPGETQVVRFEQPVGDAAPYLNAGPGRIPSAHKRLLSYLKQFGVAVEVYVMNSMSNLVQMKDGPLGNDEPVVYRRLDHNTRGWLAQMVYERAEDLLRCSGIEIAEEDIPERTRQLRSLMISFGELIAEDDEHPENVGKYVPTEGEEGFENARSRAGFDVLPGVHAGRIAEALDLAALLESKFWKKTRFYQPVDFLWQQTLFQPVGGMDQVQHAFARQVASLGGTIHLNSPVRHIGWDSETREFVIQVGQMGTEETIEYRADYCFSNLAMPFLRDIVSNDLQGEGEGGFNAEFKAGLHAVYKAQFDPTPPKDWKPCDLKDDDCYIPRFLANTTKVGWQADRELWQGRPMERSHDDEHGAETIDPPKSEVGVVPIFGGISWTQHEIVQIWYPSNDYHDEKGILTGAYNFADTAFRWGRMDVQDRLDCARQGAARFDETFAAGLDDGVAIAWQNMPYIKGGWAQWQTVDDAVAHFNVLDQGTGIVGADGTESDPVFFVIGDQISSLPGWQEGAIASALIALSRMERPDLATPHLRTLPDPRLMVEGV